MPLIEVNEMRLTLTAHQRTQVWRFARLLVLGLAGVGLSLWAKSPVGALLVPVIEGAYRQVVPATTDSLHPGPQEGSRE